MRLFNNASFDMVQNSLNEISFHLHNIYINQESVVAQKHKGINESRIGLTRLNTKKYPVWTAITQARCEFAVNLN